VAVAPIGPAGSGTGAGAAKTAAAAKSTKSLESILRKRSTSGYAEGLVFYDKRRRISVECCIEANIGVEEGSL
jgi:hypothetical protein